MCSDFRNCKTIHKMALKPEFIKVEKNEGIRTKYGRRHKYSIDHSDPAHRNINNWTVIPNDTISHAACCSRDFFNYVRRDFREQHTNLSLATMELEVDSTLRAWQIVGQYGPELEGRLSSKTFIAVAYRNRKNVQ